MTELVSYNLIVAGDVFAEDLAELPKIAERVREQLKGIDIRAAEKHLVVDSDDISLWFENEGCIYDQVNIQIEGFTCVCVQFVLDQVTDDPSLCRFDEYIETEYYEAHVSFACRVYRGIICYVAKPHETLPPPQEPLHDTTDIFDGTYL